MEPWMKMSFLLSVFGFLKEFRPSEPFVTQYLLNPPINVTAEQLNQEIYPIGTYAYMAQLIAVFLLTDYLRYKLVIIVHSASGIVVFVMLILCPALPASLLLPTLQMLERVYGTFLACEVAYFTYIYAKVDKKHYQEVTSHTRAAFLLGRCLCGLVGQALISSGFASYYHLNFISLAGMSLATLWALFLPRVTTSMYFHRNILVANSLSPLGGTVGKPLDEGPKNKECVHQSAKITSCKCFSGCSTAFRYLWKDFADAFTNPYVLKWTFWWALATCGFYQIWSYVQLLWAVVLEDAGDKDHQLYNGAVEAVYTAVGALASFGCGKLRVDWKTAGEPTLALCSLFLAYVLYTSAKTFTIWIAYATYISFTITYQAIITVANAEVAKHINADSYGLIFGVTTFVALVLQTVLTYVVCSKDGFALGIRDQFMVYSGYFGVLGVIFTFTATHSWMASWFHPQGPSPEMVAVTDL